MSPKQLSSPFQISEVRPQISESFLAQGPNMPSGAGNDCDPIMKSAAQNDVIVDQRERTRIEHKTHYDQIQMMVTLPV